MFLKNFIETQEVPGIEVSLSDGTRRLITDPEESDEPEKSEESEPKVPKESLMEEWMRGEMKAWEEKMEKLMQDLIRQETQHMQSENTLMQVLQENQQIRLEMNLLMQNHAVIRQENQQMRLEMNLMIQDHALVRQENQQMQLETEALRGQVQALSSHVDILASQSNYMSEVLGQMLTPFPSPVPSPGFPMLPLSPTQYPQYPMF